VATSQPITVAMTAMEMASAAAEPASRLARRTRSGCGQAGLD
jgi:hypothetical protein